MKTANYLSIISSIILLLMLSSPAHA
ncbi:MAG: hypothetical protein ACI9SC_002581, partial [Gammaproteobacteria bacterium]